MRNWSVANTHPVTIFRKHHFLHNLRIGPISLTVTLKDTEKACQGEKFRILGLICKLWRKWSALNFHPGTIFANFHFLCCEPMGPKSLSVWLHSAGKVCPDKHYHFLGPFISCKENYVLDIYTQGPYSQHFI